MKVRKRAQQIERRIVIESPLADNSAAIVEIIDRAIEDTRSLDERAA